MKRILNLIAALLLVAVAGSAQPQDRQAMVTLSHEGNLTFFTNLDAFQDALNAATDGDIIYISEGIVTASSEAVINKRLNIIGCGYNSYIVCPVRIDMGGVTAEETTTPMFDGVRLKQLRANDWEPSIDNTKNLTIRNCYVDDFRRGSYMAQNLNIIGCFLKMAEFADNYFSKVTIQNSKIGSIKWADRATFINCNVRSCNRLPLSAISSIIIYEPEEDFYIPNGTPTFYNTVTKYDLPSEVYTENCYTGISGLTMDEETLEVNMNPETQGWIGQDGTIVGIHGGVYPFTENPTVPTIDAANSSVEYDAANKRLNVTIKANPN